MASEPKKVAFGYIRVSTGRQAALGVSLDAQREQIQAWCTFKGYALGEVFVDGGISGKKSKNRPGLQRAIEVACQAQAPLVVFSLSRFARSTLDAIVNSMRLEKAGADLVSLKEQFDTTSSTGRLLFRVMAAFAEFERERISEQTSTALDFIRSKGHKLGGTVPFGSNAVEVGRNKEGKIIWGLVPNQTESTVRDRIIELRAAGKSLRAIAELLNAEQIKSKTGKPWGASSIQSILNSVAKSKK